VSLINPITGGLLDMTTFGLLGGGGGSVAKLGPQLAPPAPTAGNAHPARPAAPAGPAAPATGKTRILPFLIGAGIAFALADTRAAPIVIAILVGAIIFQLTRASDPQSAGR